MFRHTRSYVAFTQDQQSGRHCPARSLREAKARHDSYIGVEHLALALVAMNDGMVPPILSALGTS